MWAGCRRLVRFEASLYLGAFCLKACCLLAASAQLESLLPTLKYFRDVSHVRRAISDVLHSDPRRWHCLTFFAYASLASSPPAPTCARLCSPPNHLRSFMKISVKCQTRAQEMSCVHGSLVLRQTPFSLLHLALLFHAILNECRWAVRSSEATSKLLVRGSFCSVCISEIKETLARVPPRLSSSRWIRWM